MLVLASFPTISAAGKKLALHPIMCTHQVSSICSVLSFLLFFSIRLAMGLAERKDCSSSCGLQNISYPFRLKDDPAGCGLSSQYQLICEGNKTILDIQSDKFYYAGNGLAFHFLKETRYYVTEISYDQQEINVVDSGLASGRCGLPTRSSPFEWDDSENSYDDFWLSFPYQLQWYTWSIFMNCTRQIKNDTYQFIPCLSHNNNTFAYVVVGEDANSLQFLEPSCRFLAAIPTAGSPEMDSTTDVFKLLQKGFVLSWDDDLQRFSFQPCLDELRRLFRRIETADVSVPSKILAAYDLNFYFV
uniref:Uncharacterized protein LOC114913843 n=1 Tax=Elaeis guineensis var. tenera TaxID=51953 RepID=A0A8N4I6Q7_ELAGV